MLIGRSESCERVAAWSKTGGGPLTIHGPPGVGKTALARHVLPSWRVVDGRNFDEDALVALPREDHVVWDGVDGAVAARVLSRSPRRVVVTTRTRVACDGEEALELGPLDPADASLLLQRAIERSGLRLRRGDAGVLGPSFGGLPGVILAAAGWYDVLGVEGLTRFSPRVWRCGSPPQFLGSMCSSLDSMWEALNGTERSSLATLAMVGGEIRFALAEALLGERAFPDLRVLRDYSWLVSDRPGQQRMLAPIRSYVLHRAPPSAEAVEQFVDTVLSLAAVDWPEFDRTGIATHISYVADLPEVCSGRLDDPCVVPALAILVRLQPSHAQGVLTKEALRRHPGSVDLLRTSCHLDMVRGDFEEAHTTIGRLLELGDERVRAACHGTLGTIAVMEHRREDARAHYEEALALSRAHGDDPRGIGFALSHLGNLAHDLGEADRALACYGDAVAVWRELGQVGMEFLMRSNAAQVMAMQGRFTDAVRESEHLVGLFEPTLDRRVRAAVLSAFGWVCFCSDALEDARDHLQTARDVFGEHPDARMRGILVAQLAAAQACLGELGRAAEGFHDADVILADRADRSRGIVSLLRGFADLASGHRDDAVQRLRSARQADGHPALVEVSADARMAAVALEGRLVATAGTSLCLGDQGQWFRLRDQEPVSLGRFSHARRILLSLAEARLQHPGRGLGVEALFAIGWPEETITEGSMRNRVHVCLNRLRTAGLKPILLRGNDGYLLDPELGVLLTSRVNPPWT